MLQAARIAFLSAVIVSAAFACESLAAPPAAKKGVQWQTDLQEAHKISVKEKRPMLIVFGAPSCVYCKKLETEHFADHKFVEYVNEQFVVVKLDYEKNKKAAEVLEIKNLPTSVVLSPEADLLGTVVGYVQLDKYKKLLETAVDTQDTLEKTAGK